MLVCGSSHCLERTNCANIQIDNSALPGLADYEFCVDANTVLEFFDFVDATTTLNAVAVTEDFVSAELAVVLAAFGFGVTHGTSLTNR